MVMRFYPRIHYYILPTFVLVLEDSVSTSYGGNGGKPKALDSPSRAKMISN